VTGPIRRFDPAELRGPGEPDPSQAEQAEALRAARDLEAVAGLADRIGPTEGFEDRVMAAIAAEPAPRVVLRPAASVRGGRLAALLLAIRESWAVATSGGRPLAVRAQALAVVFLVVVAAASLTGVAAVGVGSLLNGNRTPTPSVVPLPSATPSAAPTNPPTLSPGPSMTGSPEPTETPETTDTPGATGHGGSTETARPTRTPRPTETAKPTETPGGTDDHGGGGGGGPSSTDDGGGSGGGPGPG
jgi:uncharacterized membrane protein YgcG